MFSADQHRRADPAPSVQGFPDAEVEFKFNTEKGDPVKDAIQNWFEGCLGTIKWVASPSIRR